jgi:hypothetical protein
MTINLTICLWGSRRREELALVHGDLLDRWPE